MTTILYVAWAPFFAGAERALLLLLQALDPRRYRPHVIVGTDGELRAQLAAAGIETTHVALAYTDRRRPIPWIRSVARIVGVARSVGAALIHSNGVPGFQPAGYAARMLGIPTVVHVRGGLASYAWFLKPGFHRAVFVSHALLRDAREREPSLFRRDVEVVHGGVALARSPSDDERHTRLTALGVPTDAPSVVLSGQVVEVKGIGEYIEAARILTGQGVGATYVVLGDDLRGGGQTRRRAEATVAALGLGGRFRFLGFRRDAPDCLPLFDIAAVPSHVEPFGNATLEAMAAGRAVVGSNVGGIPEVLVDGETGVLVPPRDAVALAAALRRLIEDPALRARLGAAGRARAAASFDVGAGAARVQQVYEELLA